MNSWVEIQSEVTVQPGAGVLGSKVQDPEIRDP